MSKKREEVNSKITVVKAADGTTEIYTAENFKDLDAAQTRKRGGTLTELEVTEGKKTKPHKAKH